MSETAMRRRVRIASITEPVQPGMSGRVVVLEVEGGGLGFPVWMGQREGDAIGFALADVRVPRPQTQDLLKSLAEAHGALVTEVAITDIRNDTFFAEVSVRLGEEIAAVDARPSDAIALAVRCGAPIYAAETVLARAGAEVVTGTLEADESGALQLAAPLGDGVPIRVGEPLARRLRLRAEDTVTGRAARQPDGPGLALVIVEELNGATPVAYRDLSDIGLPVVLCLPNDWSTPPLPPWLVRYGIGFSPLHTRPGELTIAVRSIDVSGRDAAQVLDDLLAEQDGAYERLEDDRRFKLPAGFGATALTWTVSPIRVRGGPEHQLQWWGSDEGMTTRWMVAVQARRALLVVLEARDWAQAEAVEPLLSRCEIHEPVRDRAGLTDREIEVLKLIADGATNPAIAERLDISPHTVANHVKSILSKLEAATRAAAVSTAVSRGIVDSGPS